MSFTRVIKGPSSTRFLLCFLLLTPFALGHSFIMSVEGANGRRSSGFGTRFTTRGTLTQFTGIIKEEEIKTGAVTPCGRIFGGDSMKGFVVNVEEEFRRAENDGLPLAGHDGSVVMSVFVHNRDGAGPFACIYSTDLTMESLKPMVITHQIEGDKGINEKSKDFVYPLTSVFPPEAVCLGGKKKDACVIRCVNPKGFGSCAAVRLKRQASSNKIVHPPLQKEKNPVHPLRPKPFPPSRNPNMTAPIKTTNPSHLPPSTSAQNLKLPITFPDADEEAESPATFTGQNDTPSDSSPEEDAVIQQKGIPSVKSLDGSEPHEFPSEAYDEDSDEPDENTGGLKVKEISGGSQTNGNPGGPKMYALGDLV